MYIKKKLLLCLKAFKLLNYNMNKKNDKYEIDQLHNFANWSYFKACFGRLQFLCIRGSPNKVYIFLIEAKKTLDVILLVKHQYLVDIVYGNKEEPWMFETLSIFIASVVGQF